MADGDAVVHDIKRVVDLLRAVVGGFAARGFQLVGEVPQQLEFGGVGVIELARGHCFFVEQGFQRVVAQVGGDVQAFDAALAADDCQRFGIRFHIQRERGADLVGAQREGLHHVVRQHGDLVARHVHGGHALRGDGVDGRVRGDAQRGCGDMDADAPVAVGQFFQRERVVDLGGAGIVDAEGVDRRQRQFGMLFHRDLGEGGAAREILEQELVQVIVVRGRQRAAACSRCAADICVAAQAASSALTSMVLRSGLYSTMDRCSANSAGNWKLLSCSV